MRNSQAQQEQYSRKTTTNRRVSFTDFYLVFPTNFRIENLCDTNTVNVILQESYCGTITEPGLPVVEERDLRTLISPFHKFEVAQIEFTFYAVTFP